jgi:hypothetical protein
MSLSSAESRGSPNATPQHHTDTPATSPSTSEPPSWSPCKAGSLSTLSAEAVEFLSNLENYIPLGCLWFENFTAIEQDADLSQWQDIISLPIHGFGLDSHLAKLLEAGWIRVQTGRSTENCRLIIYRIYALPGDAGNRFIDRLNKKLWSALECLISEVDSGRETWEGRPRPESRRKFDCWATRDDGSLFYMFNRLPSPSPTVNAVTEKYSREALEDLLDPASVLPGLKTVLYPYQRRAAGLMLQREAAPTLQLDPRLEQRIAPDGSTFYYGARDLLLLRQPRFYEACRGGILGETMGLGKTVILLSLILATRHHAPRIPAPYSLPQRRAFVGSLFSMAVSAINRKSVPWKVEFERIEHASGTDMTACKEMLEQSPAFYEIPREPQRWNRKTVQPPPMKMTLAATTIIVVPRNLCRQWQSELQKHVETDALRVLVMEDIKRALPPPEELRSYDIVLFSRNRFEMEIRDGSDEQGRRILATQLACRCPYIGATRTRDCNCVRSDDLYDSPLKHLHFKRLVIDEGHFFSNQSGTAVTVANKLVKVDHRWVVSGTPAKDLLGVEMDMSSAENLWHTPETKDCREAVLEQRRTFSQKEDTSGAIKSLGSLASSFLRIRPWCALDFGERKADWDDYIYRHEDLRKRTYSGFSSCLRRTLESMVVKTQPEDVERDIELPPLSHEVIRIQPSFYDKLTANLFTLVLTANAVTSERTDADYLFHKNSAKARYQLISNLRQSAFFWTGFSEADVEASVKNSTGYLAKENTGCTQGDRALMHGTLSAANDILASEGWKAMSRSHEIGLFVKSWPEDSAEHWCFDEPREPLLTGVSQLLEAQKYVDARAGTENPGEGLAGAGVRALAPARHGAIKQEDSEKKKGEKPVLTKSGLPTSSLDGEPALKRRSSSSGKSAKSPHKISRAFKVTKSTKASKSGSKSSEKMDHAIKKQSTESSVAGSSTPLPPSRKRRRSEIEDIEFNPASPYLQSRIVGTTSAKLSYLVSQILRYYQEEKILVFYDGDNVAYYIAQALELLHIRHEIYAKSLGAHLKSEYVVRFDQEPQDRVLLMDVKQAAFGLNLSSASRIYFVNPVCRPNVEAQAIKRAHRIGQTRTVYVETLVLKGTIEEKMLERSKRMTRLEHRDAKVLEDDGGIRDIIQSARLLPLYDYERTVQGQVALLEQPQQLWGRPGWKKTVTPMMPASRPEKKEKRATTFGGITNADAGAKLIEEDDVPSPNVKRRRLAFVDCTNPHEEDTLIDEETDDEPLLDRWARISQTTPAKHSDHSVCTNTGMRSDRDPVFFAMPAAERLAPTVLPASWNFPSGQTGPPVAQPDRRLPISALLNTDDPAPSAAPSQGAMHTERSDLLRAILERL